MKKVLIASGLRYDLAVETPEYVDELVSHLWVAMKIAPEHTGTGPLSKMMKPGIGNADRFKAMFDEATAKSSKEQYLIPYFIAGHPGTTDEDMLNWHFGWKARAFARTKFKFLSHTHATLPQCTRKDPLHRIDRDVRQYPLLDTEASDAFTSVLACHDPNLPMLRRALRRMNEQFGR